MWRNVTGRPRTIKVVKKKLIANIEFKHFNTIQIRF